MRGRARCSAGTRADRFHVINRACQIARTTDTNESRAFVDEPVEHVEIDDHAAIASGALRVRITRDSGDQPRGSEDRQPGAAG